MFKQVQLIIIIITILCSCGANKSINSQNSNTQIKFTNQEFDINNFKGKWLTHNKYQKNSFVIFKEDGYAFYSDKRYAPYKLKKDSIYIFFDTFYSRGRLINLTENEVDILWEDKERIKYTRP